MNIENALVSKLRAAAEQMPVRHLSVDDLVARGNRSLALRRFAVAGALAVAGVLGVVAADRAVSTDQGRVIDPADGMDDGVWNIVDYYDEIRAESLRFSERVDRGDMRAAWDMLSHRARVEVGSFDAWRDDFSNTQALYGWIHDSEAELYLSPMVTAPDGSIVIVTAVAPTGDDGTGLLETLAVKVAGDDVLIDVDTNDSVSLTPESPVFHAGCVGEGCEPTDRPTISDGMKLAALVGPAPDVKEVMFAVGGESLVMWAELSEAGDEVRATARFPGADVPMETVLTIAIDTHDRGVESYGYRVLYENGS